MQIIEKNKIYYPNNSMYFLTGSTFLHYPYFKTNDQKQIVLNQIKKTQERLNAKITAYSISINHYHLKFYLENGLDLKKVKQLIHGGTTFEYRKEYKTKYKDIWQSKKVLVVASDDMDWKITGYIIGNLLKHKEVNTFEELKNNSFSSYKFIVERYGDECAKELVRKIINIDENIEGEVDFKEFEKLNIFRPKD